MALTPQQVRIIEESKKQGLTREQAMAKVFIPDVKPRDTGRFVGSGSDIAAAGKGLWSDIRGRGRNIVDSTVAGVKGEQSMSETKLQIAGNVLGGAGDVVSRGIQAAVTPFMRESEEAAVVSGIQSAVEKTGIPQAISEASPRTQRNITGVFGALEGIPAMPKFLKGLFGKTDAPKVPTPAPAVAGQTAEQIGQNYVNRLRGQVNDPNISPRAKEEAAQASLTFKEKWIGLRPDEKKRLQEMGEPKITEYLDAVHLRNTSDTPTPDSPLPQNVWGAQELGNYYVTEAFNKLNGLLSETGSEIGKTRAKLATVKLQQPQVDAVTVKFDSELSKLGLSVKNGRVFELPNKIAKTTGSDVNAIQSLYDDFLKFKQSPTIENAYALRTNFDSKITFGKAARDVSNAVDPLSRSMRSVIAEESAKVIGKESAGELKKYSDFMDAYGDLKSFTDRSAGSEYLLRLILSGRGREARDLVDTIKTHTGIDLMNDATAMKIAVERFANESQQNLFKQEVTRAGYDIAGLFEKGPVGIIGTVAQRLAEHGIDAEDIIKATAAGTAGYTFMTYYGENGVTPAGIAVLSAMPSKARKEALDQAAKIAKGSGKTLKLTDDMRDETLSALMKSDSMTPASKTSAVGGQTVDMADFDELQRLKDLAEKPKGLTDIEYIEARAILEKYDSFKTVGNPPTTGKGGVSRQSVDTSGGFDGANPLYTEARKYKSAEELSTDGSPKVSPTLANFIGKNANTFNTQGAFKALDGMVRNEISASIKIRPLFDDIIGNKATGNKSWAQFIPLRELIDYPELFRAYPSAKNIRVSFMDMGKNDFGSFYLDDRGIPTLNLNRSKQDAIQTLKHEIQHFIQAKEGFSLGGNPGVLFRADVQNQVLKQQLRNVIRDKEIYRNATIGDMEYIKRTIEKTGRGEKLTTEEIADFFGDEKEFNDMAMKTYKHLHGEWEAEANSVEELLKVKSPIFGKSKYSK